MAIFLILRTVRLYASVLIIFNIKIRCERLKTIEDCFTSFAMTAVSITNDLRKTAQFAH